MSRLTPAAARDVNDIWDCLASDSIETADQVLDALESQVHTLADNPGIGDLRKDLADDRHRFSTVHSYLIVYRGEAGPIEIIRVLHAPRQMSRRDRLRRVVKLCVSFSRNMAYFRAASKKEHLPFMRYSTDPVANFLITAVNNCLDVCVLEWCKIFADPRGKHFWANVVKDPVKFEAGLLKHLALNQAEFDQQIVEVRCYRDKFVAHLDDEMFQKLPWLESAKAAVFFYHSYVVREEAKDGDLSGLPLSLETGYDKCVAEADAVLRTHGIASKSGRKLQPTSEESF